jgi:SAM-dependent methyltransferase
MSKSSENNSVEIAKRLNHLKIFRKVVDSEDNSISVGIAQYLVPKPGVVELIENSGYSEGNFEKLRERHAFLQLDSLNGTTDRLDTVLNRSGWDSSFFAGKLVLECGCGAGPDTEILRNLGATVISVDLAGVDVAARNLGHDGRSILFKGDITDLPFREKAFDIVWCHRVLQHTPEPQRTLSHILQFVKDDGAVFVHSYSRNWRQMVSWKYFLRPLTKRIDDEILYKIIKFYTPFLFRLTNFLYLIPPKRLGQILFGLSNIFLPIRNYRFRERHKDKSDEFLLEYCIHDTFDALAPKYDYPIRSKDMRQIAEKRALLRPFQIVDIGVTLLRTLPFNDLGK